MNREKVDATPRRAFTPKQRAEAFLACGGRCYLCGQKIDGEYQVDHRLALHHGGKHELSNWFCVHIPCHRDKTKTDAKASGKLRRAAKKFGVDFDPEAKKPSRLQGRGFDKSLRKKMNGTVEKRR